MAGLVQGTLVEVTGLPGPVKPVPEAAGQAEVDLNGQKAQLVSFDRNLKKWTAVTFAGDSFVIDEKYVRPLAGTELKSYDFVFGPKSDFDTVGYELADTLATKGYAVMKLMVSPEDAAECVEAAKKLEEDDHFSQLAVEFERGYLGKNSSAKTLLLDPSSADMPGYVGASPLKMMDHNFSAISQMLGPYTQEAMGFDIYSRTNMLLRMPLVEGDQEKYPPLDIDDGDAEGYLHTMARKRLTLLQFMGPSSGTLELTPLAEGGQEFTIPAEPGTVVLIVASRLEYTLKTESDALTLTCFYMAEPAIYQIFGSVKGDIEVLGMLGSGPPAPPGEQVTVNSLFCRYGTGSEGKMKFWAAVGHAATDGLTDVPFLRWDNSLYYDPDQQFGGTYTKHGCFGIEGVDLFDCKFFEISPAEAKGMDPCQRQVMEVSYMALLDGGWDKRSLQRESQNIGHFVGIDKDDWMCMSAGGLLNLSGAHGAAAAANAITSNRFSYSMNLKGASMTIDTACSSSLVCTHVSKLHLRFKDFEPMPGSIVNGLNLMLYQGPFVGCCAAGMLSHEGRSFTFNSTADGYARGELCGAACFKIKQYANDGQVMACLAGSQVNQDGRSASLTAPNGPAQEKCLNAVLKEVHLTPTEVDCFECHGTGTSLGDPIEVGSFRKVMSATPRKEPLVITSSKSNVAHGEGGAGFCGFFKCVLQVAHCEGSPNLHLKVKNPHLDMEGFPCQMLTETVVMREDSAYCGVSSFGFGGTNAHAEAWGKNIMTTRGAANLDANTAFQRKLNKAQPAEITMNSEDVSEWETTGLDPRAEAGSRWKISLDEDGVAEWERDEDDLPEFGDEFFIRGSFNDWTPDPLERHVSIQGLWTTTVTIGESGEESFQITADTEDDKIFHPGQSRCIMKAAAILGPGKATKDLAWMISGNEGDTFTVEFFQQEKHLSIMWLKQ